MNRMNVTEAGVEKRLLNIDEACNYMGLGKTFARAYLKKIGAEKKIGSRRVLFDKTVIDAAIDNNR